MAAHRLRVLTINLFGQGADWPARRAVVLAGIRELRPDLIAFQDAINSADYDQVGDLVGGTYEVVHQESAGDDGSGVSIASRCPIVEVRQLDLEVSARVAGFPCTALAAEIDAPPPVGRLFLVNKRTSWQYGAERERELEAVAVARWLEALVAERSLHVVLASDLNAAPDSASVRFLTGLQLLDGTSVCYHDAWPASPGGAVGLTFTADNPLVRAGEMPLEPGRRIDYVLVRAGAHRPTLRVSSCALAFTEPIAGVFASDHYGVLAELEVAR
ncbi:MAG: endonuclease/exonuclease/phosphatase family protein [Thermoleophilaceae bacterium]